MAVPTDEELRELLDRFVCVRIVQMWGVDLGLFQFDWAMTWAIFYMNADGAIYGRYGTRSAMRDESAREISLTGFKKSTAAALELHARYAAGPDRVRPEIAGKQTRYPPQWTRPEAIPELAKKERLAQRFTGFSEQRSERAHGVGCIHCHMVPDHEILSLRKSDLPIDDRLVWPYPMPGAIGLRMDPERRATVQHVVEGSAAARAGVRPGDEILKFDGQSVLSTADIQWVLHNAKAPARITMEFRRGAESREVVLALGADWRRRLGDWRFLDLGICMQVAGFNGRPAPDSRGSLAIRVERVHAKRLAGIDLRKGDLIVALDGRREAMNLGMLTRVLLEKKPGSELEVTRRRQGEDGAKTVRLRIE